MMKDPEKELAFQEIQALFRDQPMLILGLGASMASGRHVGVEMPSMSDLAEALRKGVPTLGLGREALKEWAVVDSLIDSVSLEPALTKVKPQEDSLLQAIREIVGKCVGDGDRKIAAAAADGKLERLPLRRLIRHLANGPIRMVNVVTTNYDHIVEYCADLEELPCATGFGGVCFRRFSENGRTSGLKEISRGGSRRNSPPRERWRRHVQLYKPHGSLNWYETGEGAVEVWGDRPKGGRVLVAPGYDKYKECVTSIVLDLQRSDANAAVRAARAVVTYGYGFNDEHVHPFVMQRVARGMPMLMIAQELTPAARKLLEAHGKVLALERDASKSEETTFWRGTEALQLEGNLWDMDEFLSTVMEV